jgi:hypothetical protein
VCVPDKRFAHRAILRKREFSHCFGKANQGILIRYGYMSDARQVVSGQPPGKPLNPIGSGKLSQEQSW